MQTEQERGQKRGKGAKAETNRGDYSGNGKCVLQIGSIPSVQLALSFAILLQARGVLVDELFPKVGFVVVVVDVGMATI